MQWPCANCPTKSVIWKNGVDIIKKKSIHHKKRFNVEGEGEGGNLASLNVAQVKNFIWPNRIGTNLLFDITLDLS